MDVELLSQRRAQERERQAKIQQQQLHTQHHHQPTSITEEITQNNVNITQQQQQPSICIGSVSQRESFERQISDGKSSSSSGSGGGGGLKITEKRTSTDGVSTSSTVIEVPSGHYHHGTSSVSPSSAIDSICKDGGTLQMGLQVRILRTKCYDDFIYFISCICACTTFKRFII